MKSRAKKIVALALNEHRAAERLKLLKDPRKTANDMWRNLRPNSSVTLHVEPSGDGWTKEEDYQEIWLADVEFLGMKMILKVAGNELVSFTTNANDRHLLNYLRRLDEDVLIRMKLHNTPQAVFTIMDRAAKQGFRQADIDRIRKSNDGKPITHYR